MTFSLNVLKGVGYVQLYKKEPLKNTVESLIDGHSFLGSGNMYYWNFPATLTDIVIVTFS